MAVLPDGALREIPIWMIEPHAAQLDLRDPPRLSLQCLTELRHLLDTILLTLEADVTPTPTNGGGA